MHYKKKARRLQKWEERFAYFSHRCDLRRRHQAPLNVIDCHLHLSVVFISREIFRLRISDCLCLTIFARSSGAYLHLYSSKVIRKNAPRRQLVCAHRDKITSYASRSRRCNAIATAPTFHVPSSSHHSSTSPSRVLASPALLPSTGRLFNIDGIVEYIPN